MINQTNSLEKSEKVSHSQSRPQPTASFDEFIAAKQRSVAGAIALEENIIENISPSLELCSQNCLPTTKPLLTHAPVQKQLIQADLSISIVSNSHLLSEAIILLLKPHRSIHLVNSYTGDVDIVPTVINPSNHLVLLDSGIGQKATVARIQQWRSIHPSPYIVVLELKNEINLILECIEAGAHGYALQGTSSTEVIQVIEQVFQGIAQCSPEVTAKLFERLTQQRNVPQFLEKTPLTRRELEVLHGIAKNYSDREIATELSVAVRTVKHHVHNILQKLNVKNRCNAAQLALENHWFNLTNI